MRDFGWYRFQYGFDVKDGKGPGGITKRHLKLSIIQEAPLLVECGSSDARVVGFVPLGPPCSDVLTLKVRCFGQVLFLCCNLLKDSHFAFTANTDVALSISVHLL